MIVSEMAYKVTLRAEEFLNGKRKVAQGVEELEKDTKRPLETVGRRFDDLTDGVKGFGKEGKQAFDRINLGMAKFLGLAVTVEGTRRLFTSATRSLVDLGNMSSFLDMNAKSLDGFNRAAAATGASEQSMTSMLMKFKNAQNWQAFPMGAPDASTIAIQQLQGMTGVNIMGGKDPGDMVLKTATALRKLKQDQAQVMWSQMGGSGDMFNLMYSGNLATLQKDFEKGSNATDEHIKNAQNVRRVMEELDQTIQNLGNDMVLAFGPAVSNLMKDFGTWVADNKDNILGFFREGSELARDFADAVGGSSNALILIAGMKAGPVGAAAALGYVIGDVTTPADQKALPDEQRHWMYRKHGAIPAMIDSAEKTVYDLFDGVLKAAGIRDGYKSNYTPDQDNIYARLANELQKHSSTPGDEKYNTRLASIMMAESSGNPNATSKAGAAGLMQLMPETAADYGITPGGRYDPETSLKGGDAHFRRLLKKFNGDYDLATYAYNGGEGRVGSWDKGGRTGALPKETAEYLERVKEQERMIEYYKQFSRPSSRPTGMAGQVDNSQTSTIQIHKVEVNSNPQTVGALQADIENQARRSRMTVSYASGNN
ncbi:lytic transglycosylase domain-containing protein [Aeromonas veronii]|uniref:lytic transglycosylase domain-containing protein n=1 Tax=Aeromonas veronii TaxID=654 RepID=UPI001302A33F|nr:transglycosylase SLT domain-containing protein [Aeromonas veronii]KAE9627742.1 transglycosylase SLT domain-containing protein [Aeromonas veronii]